jgi:hypothetical protein
MTLAPVILSLALLQQPAPTPVQRPAEITISVDEYVRLKSCEAQMREKKQKQSKFYWIAIGAVTAIAIVAVAKKKQ